MSLAALLNNDSDKEGNTRVTVVDKSTTAANRERFLNKLNKEFNVVKQRDTLENNYQDWKFINYQEFELISEWNQQSKDWNANEQNFKELYNDMKSIKNEWNQYNTLKSNEHYLDGKIKMKPPSKRRRSKNRTLPNNKGISSIGHKNNLTTGTVNGIISETTNRNQELTNGRINSNINDNIVLLTGEDECEDDGANADSDDDINGQEHDNEDEDDEKENIEGDEDDENNIMVALDGNDDDGDDEFIPGNKKSGSAKSSDGSHYGSNKIVTINSEKPRIVRELIKMCNKNKINKIRKRRFTNAIITDYNPGSKQLILKVTLKQYHVKRLKKLISDAKKQKEIEEKDKLDILNKSNNVNDSSINDSDNDALSKNKKRKLNIKSSSISSSETNVKDSDIENNVNNNTQNLRRANSHGLPTYGMKMTAKEARAIKRHFDNTFFTVWKDLARKDAAKVARLVQQIQSIRSTNFRKTSSVCAREAKKWQQRNFKQVKDFQTRARRGIREMSNFWKKNEREERDLKKKAEKDAIENARKEEEERDNKRQAKKLNFLLTQTELYSHFIGSKIKTDELEGNMQDERFNASNQNKHNIDLDSTEAYRTEFTSIDFENEDDELLRIKAAQNASNVLQETRAKTKQFDNDTSNGEELNFQNPTSLGEITIEQPDMLACTLKEYQLKGLNWLANLYDQGINGILADEMGLGKTVQSIAVLAHLAERYNIWGPFLVVTPASTLHNWVNEITKFVPQFKILPYWGNAGDRKILRRFWDRKNMRYGKDAPFHVMITSYQMVVSDVSYIQKMKWQYMILDEAQAIKSSQSSRWKNLLSFHCRNRLLLTGTPIQNSMQELWALLHFIMPSLFDSHDEFNDWFSKDIESHAEANTQLNQQQLRRLHMILKPFMLRRVKKNVQSELGDKIEIDVMCDLTQRQAKLYRVLKSQMSSNYDAIENAAGSEFSGSDQNMINAVMQFRKVCNHPDLFERADIDSPFSFSVYGKSTPVSRDGETTDLMYSTNNPITYHVPRLIYNDILLPNFENDLDVRSKLLRHTFNIFANTINKCLLQGLSRVTGLSENMINEIAFKDIVKNAIELDQYPMTKLQNASIFHDSENSYLETNFEKSLMIIDRSKQLDALRGVTTGGILDSLLNIKDTVYEDQYFNSLQPGYHPGASAPPISLQILGSSHSSRSHERDMFDPVVSQALSDINPLTQYNMLVKKKIPKENFPKAGLYPEPFNKSFSSCISMPSMDRFITESAKLKKLDELLVQLKKNDHRVLIYFQMTRMMDLMEEYLTYRQYNHIRLDGSSKLEDRRDLVHDWQTRPEIFIFLLSTRAGGLGINLTAADTVIFYDSDWNPTIDSQAMDRAHRLGQTRQVTVYRLLVRGTIEERMRDRAKQKEAVQQVVMEGKTQEDNTKTIEPNNSII